MNSEVEDDRRGRKGEFHLLFVKRGYAKAQTNLTFEFDAEECAQILPFNKTLSPLPDLLARAVEIIQED